MNGSLSRRVGGGSRRGSLVRLVLIVFGATSDQRYELGITIADPVRADECRTSRPAGHHAVTASDPGPRKIGLLVVDDDAAWRDALRPWLESEGFRVLMLARGESVVSAVELHQPDVVVLDVELPGANGLEVLASLNRRWQALPVVIMTAFGGPAVANAARELGAAAYLEKPFRVLALVDEIRRVARRRADFKAANG